ncbi:hypothetical protein [Legionella sainthelensi]|uniref:hypothetical protein n=1 Tax=Legionella sainthelensi TaxID=28087 RepID=UPI000E1FB63B|nr:hypothetical protein [Legionella sainthelensi]
MKKFLLAVPLSFVSMVSNAGLSLLENVVLIYSGPATKNTHTLPEIFKSVCAQTPTGICTPTTTVPMTNAKTGRFAGEIHVWTKDGTTGSFGTSCFTELIEYKLIGGSIYTIGNTNGTCGAAVDPSLVPVPSSGPSDPIVLVGGGSGKIVDANGFYFYLRDGKYIDRTYVGLGVGAGGVPEIKNYSGLYFQLMPKFRKVSDNPAS